MSEAIDSQRILLNDTAEIDKSSEVTLNPANAQNVLLGFLNRKTSSSGQKFWQEPRDRTWLQYGHKLARIQLYESFDKLDITVTLEDTDNVHPSEICPAVNLPKLPGQTRILYQQVGNILQAISDASFKEVLQHFSTQDPKLTSWMRKNVNELGFTISRDELGTVEAFKSFTPRLKAA